MERIFCAGVTPAMEYACSHLESRGFEISSESPAQAKHLLLDVPSFSPDGKLRGGGDWMDLLNHLNGSGFVWGGNLDMTVPAEYRALDLLKDARYLAENAYITAEAVLDVILPRFSGLLRGCPVLVIGWGRIGKCLASILRRLDAFVTVAARKESDRAMAEALGYRTVDTGRIRESISRYRLILNTVPASVLGRDEISLCCPDCLKVELASVPGMEGDNIVSARGLPGKYRPEASGKLIADTMLRIMRKEGLL